jgi:hypothetical protein
MKSACLRTLVLAFSLLIFACSPPKELPPSELRTLLFAIEPDPANPGIAFDPAAAVKALQDRLDPTHAGRFAVHAIDHRQIEVRFKSEEDPAEVQRLVMARGVLDFRIAVRPEEVLEEKASLGEKLKTDGPAKPVTVNGMVARWYRIQPVGSASFADYACVKGVYAGASYLLCYDDPTMRITHDDADWRVTPDRPVTDKTTRRLLLPFSLDAAAAKRMGDLTGRNHGRAMCILLDDAAMTAPTIQSRISDRAVISFSADPNGPSAKAEQQADLMYRLLSAPPLRASLKPVTTVR